MCDYLKNLCKYGLTEEEKKEMDLLKNELKRYKEMDLVSKENPHSNSNSESDN